MPHSISLPSVHRLAKPLAGLLLTLILGISSLYLSTFSLFSQLGLSALTLAILLGMVLGNTLFRPLAPLCETGVQFSKQRLLRLGIILYGFRITFQQIGDIGLPGIFIDMMTLSSTFLLTCWLGKHVFRLDTETTYLIGAGSSICGAAAVMATVPVVRSSAEKVTVAVSTVVLFGTLAIFTYPLLYQALGHFTQMPPEQNMFGLYIGSTVHEVAQVVAAGQAIGTEAGDAAVISKMIRVMMLAPFLLLLAAYLKRQSQTSETIQNPNTSLNIPWFALIFIVVAGFNSLHLLPAYLVDKLIQLDTLLLAMAMAALGLHTHFNTLRQAGLKPILLAGIIFVWLIVGGGLINLGMNPLFH